MGSAVAAAGATLGAVSESVRDSGLFHDGVGHMPPLCEGMLNDST